MPADVFQQLINGHAYDFSSIEIAIGPVIITRITELSYSDTLEPGVLRGTRPQKLARTRGQYDAEGSMSLYKDEFRLLTSALALLPTPPVGGYMEKSFLITVIYTEVLAGNPLPITDVLQGCRITSAEDSHSEGNDPLVVSVDLDIMRVLRSGLPAVLDNTGIP